jgi:hypothetical protein
MNDEPKKTANCIPRPHYLAGKPRVLFFATRQIQNGEELRYDYGGGDLPWREVSHTMLNSLSVEFVLIIMSSFNILWSDIWC